MRFDKGNKIAERAITECRDGKCKIRVTSMPGDDVEYVELCWESDQYMLPADVFRRWCEEVAEHNDEVDTTGDSRWSFIWVTLRDLEQHAAGLLV